MKNQSGAIHKSAPCGKHLKELTYSNVIHNTAAITCRSNPPPRTQGHQREASPTPTEPSPKYCPPPILPPPQGPLSKGLCKFFFTANRPGQAKMPQINSKRPLSKNSNGAFLKQNKKWETFPTQTLPGSLSNSPTLLTRVHARSV